MRCSLLLCLALAGCVAMGESECRSADWAGLGERDGLAGTRPRIDTYAYQCGRHNVRADEKDYLNGWWVGNAEYVRRADSHEGPN
jgi:hypothetical protein